jgi:aspartate-semialdehyde dehydrogenase
VLDLKLFSIGKSTKVIDLETFDFSKVKITFFAAGGKISENFAEIAAKHSLVIDNSSFYRMDPDVPLIVPSGKLRPSK